MIAYISQILDDLLRIDYKYSEQSDMCVYHVCLFVGCLQCHYAETHVSFMFVFCVYLDYTGHTTPTITNATTTTTTTPSLNVRSTTAAARSFSTSTTTSLSSGSKTCSGDIYLFIYQVSYSSLYFCLTSRCRLILNAQSYFVVFFIKAAILFFFDLTLQNASYIRCS